jgi:hypothetical protein
MLRRLEKSPAAVFLGTEFATTYAQEFEWAKEEKLVRLLSTVPAGRSLWWHDRLLTVVEVDGELEAFDDEEPNFDPLIIGQGDLAKYQVDLEALAARLHSVNGLGGRLDVLNERLVFLGSARREGMDVAVVLALLHERRSALVHLQALPALIPARHDHVVALCPSFNPAPSVIRDLRSLNVTVTGLAKDNPWEIDYPISLKRQNGHLPRVVLSAEEEREFERYGFNSRIPIYLTGRVERRVSNVVQVGDAQVLVEGSLFRGFMRLVVALFETEEGFISRSSLRTGRGLQAQDLYFPAGLDQAVSRLRDRFRPTLGHLDAREFLEFQHFRLRLSTHRSFVRYDKAALVAHPHEGVRAMATRLP